MSTPREICLPDPANSVIPEDNDTAPYRQKLEWLMKGQMVYILFKMALFGIIAGVFQLMTLWMIYLAWSTMHFCQTLFIFFFFTLEAMTTLGFMMQANIWPLWIMAAYNVIGCIWIWQAYKAFYAKFQGISGGGGARQPMIG